MINITIYSKDLDQYLKELQSRTSNLSPVMRKISGYMLSAVEENFKEEGRPNKFAKLSGVIIGASYNIVQYYCNIGAS